MRIQIPVKSHLKKTEKMSIKQSKGALLSKTKMKVKTTLGGIIKAAIADWQMLLSRKSFYADGLATEEAAPRNGESGKWSNALRA